MRLFSRANLLNSKYYLNISYSLRVFFTSKTVFLAALELLFEEELIKGSLLSYISIDENGLILNAYVVTG